jgi:REP element-mobilizing transposase RayT
MPLHKHLRRLDRVWIPNAVYFVTACTHDRRPVLASQPVADVLRQKWATASTRHRWRIGRYVIMPDHVHFFCMEQPGGAKQALAVFMNRWKEWTAKGACRVLNLAPPFWQKQFFDHVLRHDESYAEKWAYVRENPVRAKLVECWEDWPWQGFVDFDSPLG